MLKGHFDGASRGNPGDAGAGALLYDENNHIIWQQKLYLGSKTNNEAEYEALLMLLREIDNRGFQRVTIRGDSRLVVCQMNKEWKINSLHLKELWQRAQELSRGKNLSYEWVPRNENSDADRLSNEAIDDHYGAKKMETIEFVEVVDKVETGRNRSVEFDLSLLEQITDTLFIAHGTEDYAVDILHRACTCPAFVHRRRCKHLDAALKKKSQEMNMK
ncbi:MAG: ribonuclease HI family protein [Aminobacterium sp.]|jgi:ribonuclease HI|uniref:ribonuclease HI family protein n=1 Tax=unclassified Aminobacterium TaxID=2685012 RepID=UPI001BCF512F|nr:MULTISPECIES: ribonuclease HI family protein [unclassified Aminobacterium]MDD2206870.1 ribonuclease HI family protein [Aminobacterium sp.]MDD3425416.1 ribonuclease HI family protein [Aminobacterium sp.]MDD3707894.1 ribonuclease HI family protein [Aminobacterium sp.]MDD4229505.1 ribonuclease HI family protein [Aminobacterium sp.]MDD4551009.1 ribonuclease HI family protein [Aminobacterium sp.]